MEDRLGISIPAVVRAIANSEFGMEWADCERLGKKIDSMLRYAGWLTLDNGQTFCREVNNGA